jgi:hypothetical protein
MKTPSLAECAAFLREPGPINSTSLTQALIAKMSASELREKIRREQESIAGYLHAREKAAATNKPAPPARKAPATPAARRPAPAPAGKAVAAPALAGKATAGKAVAAARPLLAVATDMLCRALRMPGITDADKTAARAELEARGVHVMPKGGFSKSLI